MPARGRLSTKITISEKVPYFNAPIYLESKAQIGKVEEILTETHQTCSGPPLPRQT